jgi:hypothetical protein
VILAAPLAPTPGQVALGVLTVLAGALIATASAFMARRSHNWLHHLSTAGGLLIVAGVVGQRTVSGSAMGAWDAGISVPVIGVRLNPVAAAGIVLTLVGLTVTLLFERVVDESDRPAPLIHRPLEDDDAI